MLGGTVGAGVYCVYPGSSLLSKTRLSHTGALASPRSWRFPQLVLKKRSIEGSATTSSSICTIAGRPRAKWDDERLVRQLEIRHDA